jgi:uncharacterized protein YecE (DUF72 family)
MYRIGTSGYSFKDWAGIIYPKNVKPADYLSYYEKELGFNAVEINYTYYKPPTAKTLEGMSSRTSDAFEFIIKAYKDMTHDLKRSKENVEPAKKVFQDFVEALKPLKERKRLGGILAQFPFSFHASRGNAEYLLRFKELTGEIPLFIEFRNSEWMREETFSFLRKKVLGYCAVDEPPLKGLVPFREEATTDTGYVRLHGRNTKWFESDAAERYNYDYSGEELTDISKKIKSISKKTKKTYIFFNNCHQGFAAKNARKLMSIIK